MTIKTWVKEIGVTYMKEEVAILHGYESEVVTPNKFKQHPVTKHWKVSTKNHRK